MTFFALKDRALARLFAVLTILTLVVSLFPVHAFAQVHHDQQPQDNSFTFGGDDNEQWSHPSNWPTPAQYCEALDTHISDIESQIDSAPRLKKALLQAALHLLTGLYDRSCKGTVTVTKVVEGTTTVSADDFTLTVGDTEVTSGEATDIASGDYTISESAHDGISTDYTATYSNDCPNGEVTVLAGQKTDCTITNTYNPPKPTTGTLIITKYECPADTSVTRDANGVNGTEPDGCSLEAGATFGYVHGDANDANSPYPELPSNGGVIIEAGVTDGSGLLTVPNLTADGRYLVVETDGSNNQLPAEAILGLFCTGDGDTSGQNDNQELTFIPAGQSVNCVAYNKMKEEPETPVATVTATKIVCTDEADLPNWGNGGPNITATTAADWVSENHPSCSLQPNWQFEWAHANIADPRDTVTIGSAGAGWTPFDTVTNAQGQATINLSAADLNGDSSIWVREDLQDGYIPFTWSDNHDNSNPVSAEMYCASDVLNYDNWDRVDNVATGNSYNCVAWNVPKPKVEVPVCPIGDELLQNGSFETPVGADVSGWDIFASGTSGLSWLVSWVSAFTGAPEVANIELHHGVNGWLPSNGSQYAELDSDWAGPSSSQTGEEASTRIAQTVVTDPGATYELKYDFSARPGTPTADNALNVYVGGTLADTQSADGTVLSNQTSWTSYTKDFVATSSNTEIAFADGGTANSLGTLVDNASLCKVKEAPKVPSVTISASKVVCDTEADLPDGNLTTPISSHAAQDWVDQSGGKCHMQEGWDFEWGPSGAGDGGPTTIGHAANYTTFGSTNEDGVVTTNVPLAAVNGTIEMREVLQSGYVPFTNDNNNNVTAKLYCATDGGNNDNWEWIQNPTDGQTYNCVAFNAPIVPPAPICENEPQGSGADAVVSFDQGLDLASTSVAGARSSSTAALGDSDWNSGDTTGFVSLGFGGSIVLSFDSYVPNVAGTDLQIHEATNGVYPLETAEIWVSQDNSTWKLAGTANNTGVNKITDIDFDSTGYSWIKFVKVVDTTATLGQHSGADGFDLDAVVATQQVCEQPADPVPHTCELTVVSDTSDHAQSMDANAELVGLPHHVSWTAVVGDGAEWIWSMDPITDPVNQTSDTFTKSFNWNGSVGSATLTIAADNSYVAKVNGTEAASDATEFNYVASTVHDVKSLIQNGTNNLSFDVTNWALPGGTAQSNPGGLIYSLKITGDDADCSDGDNTDGGGDTPKHTLHIDATGDGDGVITSDDENINCDSTNPEETSCEATFDEGTVVNLHVAPNAGSNFEHSWAVASGTCTGNNTSCSVTMTGDVDLTAHFDLDDTDGGNNTPVVDLATNRTNGSGTTIPQFGVGGGNTVIPPVGQVLGAATSVMPVGAPNTGAGGTSKSPSDDLLIISLAVLSFFMTRYAFTKKA